MNRWIITLFLVLGCFGCVTRPPGTVYRELPTHQDGNVIVASFFGWRPILGFMAVDGKTLDQIYKEIIISPGCRCVTAIYAGGPVNELPWEWDTNWWGGTYPICFQAKSNHTYVFTYMHPLHKPKRLWVNEWESSEIEISKRGAGQKYSQKKDAVLIWNEGENFPTCGQNRTAESQLMEKDQLPPLCWGEFAEKKVPAGRCPNAPK